MNNAALTALTNQALKVRRELNRLEDKDADLAVLRFHYATWTELAGNYADATGQSLSDAKAILASLA